MRGEAVGDINGLLGRVMYRVHVGGELLTRAVRIRVQSHRDARHLRVSRNQQSQWRVNRSERPDLAGATDVDIGVTPATNTLPIRRFRLVVGESRDVLAAWIQIPSLSVMAAHQRYTRLTKDRYVYESLDI